MKQLRLTSDRGIPPVLLSSLLLLFMGYFLTACNMVPEPVEDISENSVQTFEDVSNEWGKERKLNDDVIISPEQENKVKIRF